MGSRAKIPKLLRISGRFFSSLVPSWLKMPKGHPPKGDRCCTWCRRSMRDGDDGWYCDACNGAGHVRCFERHLNRDGTCGYALYPERPERPSPEREFLWLRVQHTMGTAGGMCSWCRGWWSDPDKWMCDACNGAGHRICFERHLRADGTCPTNGTRPPRPDPEREMRRHR